MLSHSSLVRKSLVVLGCVGLISATGAPAHAAGDDTARVCAKRVALVESPGGATVAVVYRGDRVRIVRRNARDTWRRVLTTFRARGWLRTDRLCDEPS